MASRGQVTLKEIRKALEDCAKGSILEAKKHRNWVTYKGKIFRGLPLGPHGNRDNAEIQSGIVKKMARFHDILDCLRAALNI